MADGPVWSFRFSDSLAVSEIGFRPIFGGVILIALVVIVINLGMTWRTVDQAGPDPFLTVEKTGSGRLPGDVNPAPRKAETEAKVASAAPVESSPSGEPAPTQPEPVTPPNFPLPIVFENMKAYSNAPPEFQRDVQAIASNFTATMENSGLSPSSPEYLRLWRKALQDADVTFRLQYGDDVARAMQMNP